MILLYHVSPKPFGNTRYAKHISDILAANVQRFSRHTGIIAYVTVEPKLVTVTINRAIYWLAIFDHPPRTLVVFTLNVLFRTLCLYVRNRCTLTRGKRRVCSVPGVVRMQKRVPGE